VALAMHHSGKNQNSNSVKKIVFNPVGTLEVNFKAKKMDINQIWGLPALHNLFLKRGINV